MSGMERWITAYNNMCESELTAFDESLLMSMLQGVERQTERRVRAELSAQIEQQEETIKALQDDLSAALAQIAELTS